MDYKEKYEELVEAARAVVEGNPGLCKIDEGFERLSKLLPEKESNDEKIRKAIGAAICGTTAMSILEANGTNLSDALSYLEKQKEPHYTKRNALFDKCVENCDPEVMKRVSDEVNEMLQKEQKPNVELIQKSWYLEGYHDGKYNNEPKWLIQTGKGGPRYEENQKYGTQKPTEWSEEDKNRFNNLCSVIDESEHWNDVSKQAFKDWLKSLRPQPHWKPSEEQMEALNSIILNGSFTYVGQTQDLISLKDELKKL